MIEIKIPKKFEYVTITHSTALINIANDLQNKTEPTFQDKVNCLSYFSESPIKELRKARRSEIEGLYRIIMKLFSQYEQAEPPKEITIEGTTYELIDLDEMTGGWLLDYEVMQEDFQAHPEKLCALCYFEKELGYEDSNLMERIEKFKTTFPAYLYFDLTTFFLRRYVASTNAIALLTRAELKTMLRKQKRKQLINKIRQWFLPRLFTR